jgi:periplasmic protein TonB
MSDPRWHRATAFMAVISVHVLAIYGLWIGLADSGMRPEPAILQIEVIPTDRRREPLPPPPAPPLNLNQSVVIQVAPPEVDIPPAADPPPPEIQAAQIELTPPAPAAAEPAPHATVKPKPLHVPGGWERYPAESVGAKETGAVTITICISAAGMADSVRVTQSSGFMRLDQAAVGIGKEARFKPATEDGKPVAICLPYRIRFGINSL